MTDFPNYATGTVAVAATNATVITGTGTIWSGVNARAGDDIVIAGHTVTIIDVTDPTHIKIDPWPYAAVAAGTTYKIIQRSPLRFAGGQAMADVSTLVAAFNTSGFVFFVGSTATVPDPSYGNDGQYAYQPNTGKWWIKTAGVWILTSAPLLGTFTQTGAGAVSRDILNKLTDVVSVADFGAKTTNTAAQNTTAIQAALDTGKSVYLPPGIWPCNTLTISNGNTKFYGDSPALSVLTSASTNTTMIIVAANIGNVDISNIGLTRSVVAIAGGTGLAFAGYVDTSKVRNLEVQKQYVGILLSSTGYSELSGCYIHDNIADGVELVNTSGNGAMQWYLTSNLSQANGLRGYIVIAAAGPSQVTLGDWTNCYTFANNSFGMAFVGLSGVPVQGVRINGGFVGADGNSEIFLDTYGAQHKINNTFIELAGSGATGPGGYTTAASHVGSGIEITGNNIDVTITNVVANGNSAYGVNTLASSITNITGGRFANNSLFGVVFGDGTKAVLSGSTFSNNTSGNVQVSSNASSLVAAGNSPATINNPAREILVAPRTYYVRSDGNDANTGLTNTSGGALLTIQTAVDKVCSLDMRTNQVTIQIADGTYTGGISLGWYLGSVSPIIRGNNSTPANVVISPTSPASGGAIANGSGKVWIVLDLKVKSTTSGSGLYAYDRSGINFGNVDFGACPGFQMLAVSSSTINCLSNFTVSGNSQSLAVAGGGGGVVNLATFQVTWLNSPVYSSATITASTLGYASVWGMTHVNGGTVTGPRYSGVNNGIIFVNGAGATYIPGSSAGSVSSGAQYV